MIGVRLDDVGAAFVWLSCSINSGSDPPTTITFDNFACIYANHKPCSSYNRNHIYQALLVSCEPHISNFCCFFMYISLGFVLWSCFVTRYEHPGLMADSSSTKAIGYWVFGEDTGCWFDNKQDCFPALIWDFAERRGEHVQVFVDWIQWLMILVPWVEELTINIINTCVLTILGLLCSSLCSQNKKNGH